MKIDGTQMADDLLQRMQEAHETPEAASAGTDSPQKSFQVSDVTGPGSVESVEKSEVPELDTKLRATAEKALRGEFDSASDVRSEVVDHILRERWESKLGKAKTSKMIRQVKPTLVDDPEFTRQVDEMLIMAARELGNR